MAIVWELSAPILRQHSYQSDCTADRVLLLLDRRCFYGRRAMTGDAEPPGRAIILVLLVAALTGSCGHIRVAGDGSEPDGRLGEG
jgi:hypothetical protein